MQKQNINIHKARKLVYNVIIFQMGYKKITGVLYKTEKDPNAFAHY